MNELPSWYSQKIFSHFKRGGTTSVFLVHGDIHCLVPNPDVQEEPEVPYIPLRQFWEKTFDDGKIVIFYDVATGMNFLAQEMESEFRGITKMGNSAQESLPKEPTPCFALMERILKETENVAILIDSLHFIAPRRTAENSLPAEAGMIVSERAILQRLKNWASDQQICRNHNIVLLFTEKPQRVSDELVLTENNYIHSVHIPLPNDEERKAFLISLTERGDAYDALRKKLEHVKASIARIGMGGLRSTLERDRDRIQARLNTLPELFTLQKGSNIGTYAQETEGLTLRQILDIFLFAHGSGTPVTLEFVKEKKKEILRSEYGDLQIWIDELLVLGICNTVRTNVPLQWGERVPFAEMREVLRQVRERHLISEGDEFLARLEQECEEKAARENAKEQVRQTLNNIKGHVP